MIYYRRYIERFQLDTQHLTNAELGIYDRLLDYYYGKEKPIPAGREPGIVRATTKSDRKALSSVLEQFFYLKDGCWHQKRADHEIAVAQQARENGAKNYGPKAGPDDQPDGGPDSIPDKGPDDTPDNEPDIEPVGGSGSGHPINQNNPFNLITSQPSTQNLVGAVKRRPTRRPDGGPDSANIETWTAYCNAYESRYKTDPVRNAKVNGHIAKFVKRVGSSEAPQIAAFYLTHSRAIYVASKHDTGLMLRDAEGLRTEWATGRKVTQTQATQADRTQATGSVFQKLIDEAGTRLAATPTG